MAAVALAVSFLLVKFIANMILPGPVVLTGATIRLGVWQFLRLFLTGVVWWGIPYGVVIVCVAATAAPHMPPESHASAFAGISVLGGLLLVMMMTILRVSSWTPGAKSARQD